MAPLLILIVASLLLGGAYFTYGRWLGRRVFQLSPDAPCPSETLRDDRDYVPTAKSVVFGHHFTSIAGTGPIVGPAIAMLWGWLPALAWILIGCIFIGAVHDLGSLVVSLRNKGQTVGDIAGRLLNPRVRVIFLLILFLALTIVLAIFGLVIAAVFRQFPASIFPCMLQIPLAVAIGVWIHRKGRSLLLPSLFSLALMYVSVFAGDLGILHSLNLSLAGWPIIGWVAFLLVYSYIASVIPVWALLQPRDYINALQLVSALGLLVLGLVTAAFAGGAPLADGTRPALELVAPAVQWSPAGAPPMFPFLFITIACGAISGFHCLVSSGTSSKQLRRETDARAVGFGSMLLEGFLAVLVVLACAAGVGLGLKTAQGGVLAGPAAWTSLYGSWGAMSGLAAKVGAFVNGSANFLAAMGIPAGQAVALMGVLVASFAGTTMDTACRLQRYVIQELAGAVTTRSAWRPVRSAGRALTHPHGATLLAVLTAGLMAAMPLSGAEWSLANAGKGGMILWPLFGATNQLLGGLAFLVIYFYLRRTKRPVWFLVLPGIFMLALPFWALFTQVFIGSDDGASWLARREWLLVGIALCTMVLELWMIVEAIWRSPVGVDATAAPEGTPDGKCGTCGKCGAAAT